MTKFKKPASMSAEHAAALEALLTPSDGQNILQDQEEMAFLMLKEVLERAFKLDGLRGVLQSCEDAVTLSRNVNEQCKLADLEMPEFRLAIARVISLEFARASNERMAEIESRGGLKAMGITS